MSRSLSWRLSLAILGLVAGTSLGFALFIGAASEQLEMALLDTLVQQESDLLGERLREDPATPLPLLANTRVWLDGPDRPTTPQPFHTLPPGISHNITFDGNAYHVQRTATGRGTLTVALEINAIEYRESQLVLILALGVGTACMVAMILATLVSRRLTRPITHLAAAVTQLQPGADTPALAPQFQGLEVDRIARAMDRFMDELRAYIRRERTFAAAASHELRSPLTVLRNALELITLDPDLTARTRSTAKRALRNAELLSNLVDGLLLLARTGSESPQLAPIDAGAVVADVIAAHEELAQSQQTTIEMLSDPRRQPQLVVPESHLAIVTGNLLRNAVAASAGGTVRVELSADHLRVCDSGPGLSNTDFERFQNPFERDAGSAGVGLGLYITAEIAHRHRWHLSCANTPNGACISCEFPLA